MSDFVYKGIKNVVNIVVPVRRSNVYDNVLKSKSSRRYESCEMDCDVQICMFRRARYRSICEAEPFLGKTLFL